MRPGCGRASAGVSAGESVPGPGESGLEQETYTCDSLCISVLERRLQILLDPIQYERLEAEARRRSMSVGATVRAAIDVFLSDDVVRRDAARRALLAIDPQPAADPDFDKDAILADAFTD